MEKELVQEAETFISRAEQDFAQAIDSIPSIIEDKFNIIGQLEKEAKKAEELAKEAKKESDDLQGYQKKKFLGISYKSGDSKEIIKDTQESVKKQARAIESLSKSVTLSFQFQQKLSEVSQFLFLLGSYNIATNEAMIARLAKNLNGENLHGTRLSDNVKKQFSEVVIRLKKMRNVLTIQEKLEKRASQHTSDIKDLTDNLQKEKVTTSERFQKKDALDSEQTHQIEAILKTLDSQEKTDENLLRKTASILSEMEKVHHLDEIQTQQIQNILKSLDYKKKIDDLQTGQIEKIMEALKNISDCDDEQSKQIDSLQNELDKLNVTLSDSVSRFISFRKTSFALLSLFAIISLVNLILFICGI